MARRGSPPLFLFLFLFLSLLPFARSTDSDVLLAFKSTLDGPDAALHDWIPGSAPCSPSDNNLSHWAGVLCQDGSVYGLQLENMSLSGGLALDLLSGLPALRTISFKNNRLEGSMPNLGKLPALKSVYFSKNQFSGAIPDGIFQGMRKLKKVYLAHNNFSGPVPSSLAALPRLLELRLDDNEFTGAIPDLRQTGLKLVNVSYNNLEGPIPPGLIKMSAEWFVGNENLCGPPLSVECEPTTHLPVKKKSTSTLRILLIVITILVILAVIGVLIVLRRRGEVEQLGRPPSISKKLDSSEADKLEKGPPEYTATKKSAKESDQSRLVFVNENRERFELQDLLRASAEVLGSGNFGSSYKAILLRGPSVVVKRFKEMNGVGREDFQEHMRRLGRLSHPNLLPLVSYYYRKEEKLLMTDYIYNGSLAHMLHGNHGSSLPPLDWPTRLKIVKGVARGLAYLYEALPMLSLPHGHLKSSNVLLDESYEPLLTDYALIPVMNQTNASQIMVAYKSPEVTKTGKTSKKSDVWSFGILILEILTGKFPATYLQRGKGSNDLGGWVNSVVKEEWNGEVFDSEMKGSKNGDAPMLKLLHIGLGCCEADVDKRWEMNDVLDKIEALKEEGDESNSPVEGSRDWVSFASNK